MNLEEFVSSALCSINKGLEKARQETSKDYKIHTGGQTDDGGVHFDIAVTTSNSQNTSLDGKASAGVIQVLGAGFEVSETSKNGNSEVSRIQFTVYVPTSL